MRNTIHLLAVSGLIALITIPAMGQKEQKSMVAQELVNDLSGVGEKWISLLEAMPEETFDWRPMDGVRSVRELFTHIGDANFFFPSIVGAAAADRPKAPQDRAERENRFRTKAEIMENLRASYDYSRKSIGGLTEKTLNSDVNMFGSTTTGRAAMMTNVGHMHEHLGQAIAYARMNGVVPPWNLPKK